MPDDDNMNMMMGSSSSDESSFCSGPGMVMLMGFQVLAAGQNPNQFASDVWYVHTVQQEKTVARRIFTTSQHRSK